MGNDRGSAVHCFKPPVPGIVIASTRTGLRDRARGARPEMDVMNRQRTIPCFVSDYNKLRC